MSFGTTVTCHNLQNELLENFIAVFSKLPYKIVWKFDCDELSRKLDNAFISNWFPQQSVLGKMKNIESLFHDRQSIYITCTIY